MRSTRLTLRRVLSTASLITVIPLSACMSSHWGAQASLDSSAALRGTPVTVVNRNFSDVRIYALIGATRYPLGSVNSEETRTFIIPRGMLGGQGVLRLAADPLGGGQAQAYVSEWIPAAHGDKVELTLAPFFKLSSFVVR